MIKSVLIQIRNNIFRQAVSYMKYIIFIQKGNFVIKPYLLICVWKYKWIIYFNLSSDNVESIHVQINHTPITHFGSRNISLNDK